MDNGASSYHRFLQGDQSGLEEIVKLYNNSLIFFINSFVNDISAAEDLAAETFLELITHKYQFKENAAFKTWLFKIARNNAVDYLRKQARRSACRITDAETDLPDREVLEDAILSDERRKQLYHAMRSLHTEYRLVLHLLYFEDMSYNEAAAVLRKNHKQIKNLAYRARQALKNTLEKEGFKYEDL